MIKCIHFRFGYGGGERNIKLRGTYPLPTYHLKDISFLQLPVQGLLRPFTCRGKKDKWLLEDLDGPLGQVTSTLGSNTLKEQN